uniref:Uncharacterized protein orf360 n=1 Tax=Beta vulgaris subsp. maritima TaxID=350892 RepID=E8ZC95_BETVM|nr:hypothetical protein [Beta vulgaris subsp. maritima]
MLNPFKYIRSPLRKRLKFSVRTRIRVFFFSVCRSACKERKKKMKFQMRSSYVHFFLRGSLGLGAFFFGYGLVSEREYIMITGTNLVLIGTFLFFLVFFYRRYSLQLYQKFGKGVVLTIYFSVFFLISIYLSFLRIFICGNALPLFVELFSFLGVFGVLGQPLPLPSPSNSSSNSSQARWEAFDMGVLLESGSEEGTTDEGGPSHQDPGIPFTKNLSLEASLKGRVEALEKTKSPFLPQEEQGQYWKSLKKDLYEAPDQSEYNRKLEFENRDLLIREHKNNCFRVFQEILNEHPHLEQDSGLNPQEAFKDFVTDFQDELRAANSGYPQNERDELEFVLEIQKSLTKWGKNSYYVKKILGLI